MERYSLLFRAAVLLAGFLILPSAAHSQFPLLQYDISIYDVKTGEITKITDLDGSGEFNPSWSNNGKYLVHDVVTNTTHDLFVTEVSSGISMPLAGGEGGNDAVWSPNGQLIVFDRIPSGENNVYVVPAGGGTRSLVVSDAISPEWSPNSRMIVFRRASDGSIRVISLDGGGEIFIAPDGSSPSWSPNGQWIAYSTGGDIWKIRVRNSGEPLAAPVQVTSGPANDVHPTWINNSMTIAYHSDGAGDFDIWTVPAAGGTPAKLVGDLTVGEFDPQYSKNGQYVAYASYTPLPLICDLTTPDEHDFNDVRLLVSARGTSGYPPGGHGYFPRFACDEYVFSFGLLVGGIVNGKKTTFEAMYVSEALPSEIGSTGQPFRVFSSTVAADVTNWPPEFSDANGNPIIVANAQNLVVEYYDAFSNREAFQTLGVEIRQRSLEYDDPQKRSSVIYGWEVINRSAETIEDLCFGVWGDMDIGGGWGGGGSGFADDRVNEVNNMAFIWDHDFSEAGFISEPAVVGFDFLETPPSTSQWISGIVAGSPFSDPYRDSTQYNYIAGISHGEWHLLGDARFIQSAGAVDLAPGASVLFSGALMIGRVPAGTTSLAIDGVTNRPDPGDPILADLLQIQANVQSFYDSNLRGSIPSAPLTRRADQTLELAVPEEAGLMQSYPNPFNPRTEIRYTLETEGFVTLRVYSALGEEVAILVDGVQRAGTHAVHFEPRNLPSGVYYARLQTGGQVQVRKLLFLK